MKRGSLPTSSVRPGGSVRLQIGLHDIHDGALRATNICLGKQTQAQSSNDAQTAILVIGAVGAVLYIYYLLRPYLTMLSHVSCAAAPALPCRIY